MLKNKVAIITGSTSGIGLGIAKSFAQQGAAIMLNGLGDAAEIETIRADLEKEYGTNVLFHGADMSKADQIADLIKTTKEKLGSVDILVNNAGIQHVAPIDEFPPEKWEAIIAINLVSSFHTLRHAVPLMKEQGWGRVINIASAQGLVGTAYKSAYNAAKHGLLGLTKSVALELGQKNITVNAICPGYVRTPLVEGQIKDTAKARGITEEQALNDVILGQHATKKFTTVEQIAAMALYLCSDAAENITGTALPIDGGWTAA
jgi:3-hydroxybutyrate dehydrogenase